MTGSTSPTPAAPARSGVLSLAAVVLATGFGSGYSPFAPGTAGSAVGLLLYWPLHSLSLAVQAGATVVLFVLGVLAASEVVRRVGLTDPGIVVVDEIVGMWITLLLLPFTVRTALVGFVLFRIMDVVKPYPARQLESLHGGLGVMADDVMAGIYANLCLRVVLLVWPA